MKLIPPSRRDRVALGLCTLSLLIFVALAETAIDPLGHALLVLNGVSAASLLVSAYVFQDGTAITASPRLLLGQLDTARIALDAAQVFLEQETRRAGDLTRTVEQLDLKRASLERLVHSLQNRVDALLLLVGTQKRSLWKERFVGFVSGVLSSILAPEVATLLKWAVQILSSRPAP